MDWSASTDTTHAFRSDEDRAFREAAQLLKVPRSTLYELVRSRGLPHVKVGRALRFTCADLAIWIADNSYGRGATPRRGE
jgi:excisionase family DNA binding protein